MLDRAILDTKLDSRPMDLSFLDDILKHMQKPRFSDSDKVDKRLLIKFNQFNPNSKFIKSNLVGTKTASPVLIKNIGQMKRSHLENALNYALENSETAYNEMFLECDKQFILESWLNDFDLTKDYNETMHLVFSIKDKPDEETMQGLLHSTWESLKIRLPEYKFALVPHAHQDHAHIHCFINKTNQLTRRRLRFKGHEDCKEFFNELRSEFAYRLNDHLLSEEYLCVNEPKLKELDNIKQQLQDLEKEEKALEQIKSPQDEWDLNKALQSEYLQELKYKNKAKALDIQNNHSTPLKQKISEFKIALFNHKDTSDDEKEQLDIDRIDKRKPVKGLKSAGFLAMFSKKELENDESNDDKDNKEKEQNAQFNLKIDDVLSLNDLVLATIKRNAPSAYKEAGFVKLLENKGIGRPSTYASYLPTLVKREYISISQDKKHIITPTHKGKRVVEVFENAYQFIIDLTYTKQMEEVLDEIVENKSSYVDFISNLNSKCPKIEKLERNDDEIKPSSEGQITYIENILRNLQLNLSEEFKNYKEDNRVAKAFLDRYIKEHEFFKKNNKKASSSNNDENRPATPKQISFAEMLAKKHNVKLPKGFKYSMKVCGDFINEYHKK